MLKPLIHNPIFSFFRSQIAAPPDRSRRLRLYLRLLPIAASVFASTSGSSRSRPTSSPLPSAFPSPRSSLQTINKLPSNADRRHLLASPSSVDHQIGYGEGRFSSIGCRVSTGNILLLSAWKMSTLNPLRRIVSHVILDLDGTLLNTDGIVIEVLKVFLGQYGKKWDSKKAHRIVGRTPLEAAAAVVEDYELPCTIEEFLSTTTPMFSDQWRNIKALPGANRLIKHLRSKGVPFGLASNSSRSNIEVKLSYHHGWKESFCTIVGGNEVEKGKPSPYVFLEAARRMKVDPSNCLVIEDSLPGVMAGKAAGMVVVAAPSLPKQAGLCNSADEVINSLLDLHPEKWGLPPFEDWIEDTLPMEPWHIGGPVIKGFGRGSKVLGIPTANLPVENISGLLSEHTSGVYFGWAGLSTHGIYKMVMSIGWNPYFNNTEKTVEPWLLHEFVDDFYGEELRLIVVGYIRPEANFPSLESLIQRIYEDGRIAEKALELPIYAGYKDDAYLKISS